MSLIRLCGMSTLQVPVKEVAVITEIMPYLNDTLL